MTLDLEGMSRTAKTRAKEEAGRIIIEEIHNHLDSSTSPVEGGSFKPLKADGTASLLFQEGDMRSAITFKKRTGSNIEVGIWKKKETPKAFNHTTGDTLPKREFIPRENDNFKESISTKVERAVNDIRETDTKRVTVGELLGAFAIGVAAGVAVSDADSESSGSQTIGELGGLFGN